MAIGKLRDELTRVLQTLKGTLFGRVLWRIFRFARRALELLPLTPLGLALGLCSAVGLYHFGYGSLDRVWYLMALGMLALLLACVLTVAVAAIYLVWKAPPAESTDVLHTETQQALRTGYAMPMLRYWPFVQTQVYWERPAGVRIHHTEQAGRYQEQAVLGDHGDVDGVHRCVLVRDMFGVASVRLRHDDPLGLRVLPHAGSLRTLPLLTSLAGGDDVPHPMGVAQGDRLELRRYSPGDPARFLHWKIYARTRKLVVRTPERALSRAHRSAAYVVAGHRDGASAAAARVALEEGALGDGWRFGADGTAGAQAEVEDALTAIRRSAAARSEGGRGLMHFLEEVEAEGPVALVLFVPATPGPWQRAVSDVIATRTRPPRIVVGVDGMLPDEDTPLWQRLMLSEHGQSGDRASAVSQLVTYFESERCEVLLLDRQSGRVLGDAHLAPLRGGVLQGAA